MDRRKLRVIIVSKMGAHQKALQAMCASIPEIAVIDTITTTQHVLEKVIESLPDLLILGANLAENRVCEMVSQIKTIPNPPYCIALTLTEFTHCFDRQPGPDKVISTGSFAIRLPDVLDEVYSLAK